jgi:hypothetical protein
MNTKVFYSLKEYQIEYQNLVNAFLIDYIDNKEEDFIREQLEFYSICLDNVVFTEVWKGNDDITWSEFYIKAEAETQNVIKGIARKILILEREVNSLYNNYDPNVNVELCKQYERSFMKIISFIEEKLFEIEKPKMENFAKSLSQKSKNEIIDDDFNTSKEYELLYPELLKNYLNENEDNDELTFIETQLNYFKGLIKPIVNNYITADIEREHGIDYHYVQVRENLASFKKKISFLETKKSEIEKLTINIESYPEIDLNEETESNLPYKIALLKELGFFELEKIKKLNKENMYKIVCKITGGNIRSVKGNTLALDPISKEDREKYTSNNYLSEVGLMLSKLIK